MLLTIVDEMTCKKKVNDDVLDENEDGSEDDSDEHDDDHSHVKKTPGILCYCVHYIF